MTDYDRLLALAVPTLPSEPRANAVKSADSVSDLRAAAKRTDTSPTDGQKESGNYRKGRFSWKGLSLVIETAAGQKRKPEWPALKDHYGYVAGTESGADGDPVDVFVCEDHPDSELVFVVNQKKQDGTFDEHKCVVGCISKEQAEKVYLRNYSRGWTGMGEVTPITVEHFKWWLKNADTSVEVKNGYFAARENLKREKKAAVDPITGHADQSEKDAFFWAKNDEAKEKAKTSNLPHVRDGYIPCNGCHYRYHAMPDDEKCPQCGHELRTRLRGKKASSINENWPHLLAVKRAADEPEHAFTICVDLDGTLAEQEKPFDPDSVGEPIEKAIEWVRLFHEAGARIIIFTVRGNDKLVRAWLDANDVPYDFVNENPDQPPDSSGKVYADLYWDDRAFNAADPDEHGPAILRRVRAWAGEEDSEPQTRHPVVTIRHTVVIVGGPDVLESMERETADE